MVGPSETRAERAMMAFLPLISVLHLDKTLSYDLAMLRMMIFPPKSCRCRLQHLIYTTTPQYNINIKPAISC